MDGESLGAQIAASSLNGSHLGVLTIAKSRSKSMGPTPIPVSGAFTESLGPPVREDTLAQIERWLEVPMLMLGGVWLPLLVIKLIWGLKPMLELLGIAIWLIFIADFVI